jgi:hypothetical protein
VRTLIRFPRRWEVIPREEKESSPSFEAALKSALNTPHKPLKGKAEGEEGGEETKTEEERRLMSEFLIPQSVRRGKPALPTFEPRPTSSALAFEQDVILARQLARTMSPPRYYLRRALLRLGLMANEMAGRLQK